MNKGLSTIQCSSCGKSPSTADGNDYLYICLTHRNKKHGKTPFSSPAFILPDDILLCTPCRTRPTGRVVIEEIMEGKPFVILPDFSIETSSESKDVATKDCTTSGASSLQQCKQFTSCPPNHVYIQYS